ncbi:MAG: hypothetical protein WCJ19_01925 [bacterium]
MNNVIRTLTDRFSNQLIGDTDYIQDSFVEENVTKQISKMQGRRLIYRDQRIEGGAFISGLNSAGKIAKELLVVDSTLGKKGSGVYTKAYLELEKELNARRGKESAPNQGALLRSVYDVTNDTLKESSDGVDKIINKYGVGSKIDLSFFMNEGVGVCRHMALLSAWLIEKLITEGKIKGNISVDRNYIEGRGGHAWARFTSDAGQVFIIDPAQHYVGPLINLNPKPNMWDYKRETDL